MAKALMAMDLLGPNTAAPANLLRARAILCAGEDPGELSRAMATVCPEPSDRQFEYRCYRFWRFASTTVIWTGIGTGCLEPLLWEVLGAKVVDDIVLIGTAGRLPRSRARLGQPHGVVEAYSGGTVLDAECGDRPLRPRYRLPPGCPVASAVSTDFYYGFAPGVLQGLYPAGGDALRRAVEAHLERRDLVEMETAQFYHFCERFDRSGRLRFLAVKCPANELSVGQEQLSNSEAALRDCLTLALRLQAASEPV